MMYFYISGAGAASSVLVSIGTPFLIISMGRLYQHTYNQPRTLFIVCAVHDIKLPLTTQLDSRVHSSALLLVPPIIDSLLQFCTSSQRDCFSYQRESENISLRVPSLLVANTLSAITATVRLKMCSASHRERRR